MTVSRARKVPSQGRERSKEIPKHSAQTRHSDLERNITLQAWLFSYVHMHIIYLKLSKYTYEYIIFEYLYVAV